MTALDSRVLGMNTLSSAPQIGDADGQRPLGPAPTPSIQIYPQATMLSSQRDSQREVKSRRRVSWLARTARWLEPAASRSGEAARCLQGLPRLSRRREQPVVSWSLRCRRLQGSLRARDGSWRQEGGEDFSSSRTRPPAARARALRRAARKAAPRVPRMRRMTWACVIRAMTRHRLPHWWQRRTSWPNTRFCSGSPTEGEQDVALLRQ